MKASDTCQPDQFYLQHGQTPPTRQQQSEISFKVGKLQGIKEVVEWIRKHHLVEPDKNSLTRFSPFYQVTQEELKEWG